MDITTPTGEVDHGYRGSIGRIEPYGIEHIPDSEKHGKGSSQFFVWFTANLNFPIMILGFSAAYFGLGFVPSIIAVIAGAICGSILMGILARMGVHLGVPQQIQARGPLGFVGNIPPVAYINVFAGIGWATLNVVLAARALRLIIPAIPYWLDAAILTAAMLAIALYGYNMIHFVQRWMSFVLVILFAIVTIECLRNSAALVHANPSATGYVGPVGGFVTFGGWFFAFLVAWLPFASDYSRYLPDDPHTSRSAGMFTAIGNVVAMSWLGIAGVLLAGASSSSDPIVALRALMGGGFILALSALVLSVFTQNSLNLYGGAISIQTLGLPLDRKQAVVVMGIIAFVLSLFAAENIYTSFQAFLNLTSYFITPYVTVILLDYRFGGRSDKNRLPELYDKSRAVGWGFLSWLFGVAVSIPFWSSPLYTGAFAASHPHWGDLSMYVAAAGSLVMYFVLYSRRKDVMVSAGRGMRATG